MALSKKTRFNVFKRDGFVCQYCGRTPPAVVLECDHIHPVASGGLDASDNLITACFDCNRGKSDESLSVAPQTIADKAAILAEKEAQIKAYNKLLRAQRAREDQLINSVNTIFQSYFPDKEFSPKFREDVRRNFLPYLNSYDLEYAMHRACAKRGDHAGGAISYFCGICWGMRRQSGTHGELS